MVMVGNDWNQDSNSFLVYDDKSTGQKQVTDGWGKKKGRDAISSSSFLLAWCLLLLDVGLRSICFFKSVVVALNYPALLFLL